MIKKLICLFLASATLIMCEMDSKSKMQGMLAYSGGGKSIMTLDLSTPELNPKIIYQSSAAVSAISHITKVDDNMILFDECPVNEKCAIKQVDIKTGSEKLLIYGQLPSYMPEHDMLFFYDTWNGDQWLILSYLSSPDIRTRIAMAPGERILDNGVRQSVSNPVISISPNEFVFNGKDNQLMVYRILETKCEPINIKNYFPIAWRSKTKQLLCEEYDTRKLFLIDINNQKKEELPELTEGYGYFYVSEYDALVFGKARFRFPAGEGYDIFMFFFEEKKEVKIKSNIHIKTGIYYKKKDLGAGLDS